MPDTQHHNAPEEERGYETQEVLRPRVAIGFTVVLGACVLVTLLLMLWLHNVLVEEVRPDKRVEVRAEAPAPKPSLQAEPEIDIRQLRGREDTLLSSYGWVDRDAGIVHLPIQRAIELTAERGLPFRRQSPEALEEAGGEGNE
ncbi:MAG: hypothetical protein IH851_11005 [Armatimonadetes bacterium]|nr:hypothetical protein [Armatimonadota bacterium]